VSIAAPGPNERIGKARFRGTDLEANFGSVGVIGLRGDRPAWPRPVMVSAVTTEGTLVEVSYCLPQAAIVGTDPGSRWIDGNGMVSYESRIA
jgi:hypothetical protein